jgi:hypothetical protein
LTRPLLAVGVVAAILSAAGVALGARGFSDPAGDENAAPDATAVEISEPTAGVVAISLTIANYSVLPENSWVNLWFDVDANASTGDDAGDEALVRYLSSGTTELYTWNGSQYAAGSTAGIAASYAAGRLTVSVPRASVKAAAAFGLLVVSSRGQPVGDEELIASDFLPNAGRATFTGPGPSAFPDPAGDHDAAPDIATVRVSDARSGWITFAITTPNYAVLPEQSAVIITIDADDNPRTGESGGDLQLSLAAGEMALERWDGSRWQPDDLPTRARHRNSGNVVSIDLHVSELGNAARFRFSLLSADVNVAIQGVVAVDVAPDDFSYWRYSLANRPTLVLTATRLSARPAQPRAGKPFAVNLAVTRSDTGRPITAGSVGCRVRAAQTPVAAKGTVSGGAAHCALVVPQGAKGKTLRGTITVRTGGRAVAASFSYLVR